MADDKENKDREEIGIPERLRIKRKYTMSEAARQARIKGGQVPGKRNAFKHGKFAKNFVLNKIRPCLSTCTQYPCELVEEGSTKPGELCLDKVEVLQTYQAIIEAVREKKFDDFEDLASLKVAESINVLGMLLEDITRDGTIVREEKFDKDGNLIGYTIKAHPALLTLPKLVADLGLTPQEMNITPRQRTKTDDNEKGIKSIADLMTFAANLRDKNNQKPDDDADDS
jgi:hypothetical protein